MATPSQANWRRWAMQLALYLDNDTMTAHQLAQRLEREGWDVFPNPEERTCSEQADAVRRIIERDIRKATNGGAKFFRDDNSSPICYGLTSLGRSFVADFLLNNPNITPAKSKEPNAFRR